MLTGLYVIHDRLAEESGPVFQAPTLAVAHRNFRALMEGANVGHPDEYRLLHVGNYDNQRSVIEAFAVPADVTQQYAKTEVVE